jgi:hypothetical protein
VAAGASELGEGRSGSRSTRRRTRQGSTEPAVIGGRRRRKGKMGADLCAGLGWFTIFWRGRDFQSFGGNVEAAGFFSILTFLFIFQK